MTLVRTEDKKTVNLAQVTYLEVWSGRGSCILVLANFPTGDADQSGNVALWRGESRETAEAVLDWVTERWGYGDRMINISDAPPFREDA